MFISRHFRQWLYGEGLHQGPHKVKMELLNAKSLASEAKSSGNKRGIRTKCREDAR